MKGLWVCLLIALTIMSFAACVTPFAVCPQGWVQHGASCYSAVDVSVAWADAVELCWDLSSSLAVIKSAEENAFVTVMLRSQSLACDGVWLACNDIEEEGKWVCLAEGNTAKPMEFAIWSGNQPNDVNGQDCTMLKINDGTWFDNDCVGSRFAAVCKCHAIPRLTDEDPRGVTITSGLKCYSLDPAGRPRV